MKRSWVDETLRAAVYGPESRRSAPLIMTFAILSVPIAAGLAYAPHFMRAFLCAVKSKMNNKFPRDHDLQHKSLSPSDRQLAERLANSHKNQLETLGFYAAGIAVAVASRVPVPQLNMLAGVYVGARVAFSVAYAAPQVANGAIRSLSFVACLGTIVKIWLAAAAAASGAL